MKAALIGYGYWGRIVERYIEGQGIELFYIYCLEAIESEKKVDTLDVIWEDKTISAVFVCTPASTHFDICKAALQAGKHVFCEKPAVKTVSELCELQECARLVDKILYTDYIYTTSPSIRYIKENIDVIGDIHAVNASIEQFGMFYPKDDVYEVLGVHLMSAVYYIAGRHKGICKYTHDFSAELPLAGRIEYHLENGGKVSLYCSLTANEKVRRIQFIGEQGSIFFRMNASPNVVIHTWKQERNSVRTLEVMEKNFDETQGLCHAMREFVYEIERRDCSHNMDITMEVQAILEDRRGIE